MDPAVADSARHVEDRHEPLLISPNCWQDIRQWHVTGCPGAVRTGPADMDSRSGRHRYAGDCCCLPKEMVPQEAEPGAVQQI